MKRIRVKLIIFAAALLTLGASYATYVGVAINKTNEAAFTNAGNVLTITIVFGVLFGVVLVSGVTWIIVSVHKSITKPTRMLDRLVQGDTTQFEKPSEDEFSELTVAANKLTENLKKASVFAHAIGEGNADSSFQSAGDRDMLGNSLLQMRDKLAAITDADKKRNWSAEGLARFAEYIRKNEDQQALAFTLISELVRYTHSNQGGLFIITRDETGEEFLELSACYAFERKKFLSKRVGIGQGLLGQCYLEGTPVHLTQIPKDYVHITSGLGGATPSSVLMVPLKVNDVTEGVIELASFNKYQPHEIEFVSRVGEIIASAISSARIAERTKQMLQESQQQSEQMRAQEEEMRQNMEEMQATQELLERQASEMKKMQAVLEMEKSMFNVLMEFLPDRITYKDRESRILRINKAKAQRLNMTPQEVVGKTDYDFFSREHAEKAMKEEKALLDSGKPLMDIEEQLKFSNGDTAWVSTSRIPFKNEHNQVTGMFIITKDITKLKTAELSLRDRDEVIRQLLAELPVFHYKVNREGVIFEAWSAHENSQVPDAASLKSKPLREVFPDVSACIQQKNGHRHNVSCMGAVQINDTASLFRHHVFSDSLHEGVHWVYAVKAEDVVLPA